MQLIAYGNEDMYLMGNPQITFFKMVYRRHTNFSMESIKQTWETGNEKINGKCTSKINRGGDLIYSLYLEIKGKVKASKLNPTSKSISKINIEIGGNLIDSHTGDWLETWAELTEYNINGTIMKIGTSTNQTLFQRMSYMGGVINDSSISDEIIAIVPLQFWFCRNPGLALPIIALQYHDITINLEHTLENNFQDIKNNDLWCDYIYLDHDERRRFAGTTHEYLIEQLQSTTLTSNKNFNIEFNFPVKEIIWTKSDNSQITNEFHITLNRKDRFHKRDSTYFTRTQVWKYHRGGGGLDSSTSGVGKYNDSIAVYSFALNPEEHQPSGTCNFSNVDQAQLVYTSSSSSNITLNIYAINYNVLRIMSGMGGLAYSN